MPSFISFLSIDLSGEYSMYPGILLTIFFFFFVVMISVTIVCACIMGEGACVWRSKINSWELVLPFRCGF